MTKKVYETTFCGHNFKVEVGQLAQFANGSCLVRFEDTTILSTATSAAPRDGIDFFPLSVDYEEKMYSIGKIPGGFLKREGRPSENAILAARAIDRPMRPLFPHDLRNDVSINNLVLSVNYDYAPEVAAMIGSSIATAISDIPWNGPIAGVQVGLIDGEIILAPSQEQRDKSDLDLLVAGTAEKVCMIEAGANEVPEDLMLEAIKQGHAEIIKMCNFIKDIVAEIGKEKYTYESVALDPEITKAVESFAYDKMRQAVLTADKAQRDLQVGALADEIKAHLESIQEEWAESAAAATDALEKKVVREYLFKEHKRVDGRDLNSIRPLHAEIDVVPRVHGSGLFSRGQTQVLTIATLGTLSDAQRLDGVDEAEGKRYMHHYNFPSYSVGETRPSRGPGRREIGHGALAERALIPVLPSEEEFPYAIRTVSEVTMSNGSTSQGAICASTLSLMAAGVPIKKPVAGISSGLIINEQDEDDYIVFMDIQGIEDFFGDMDFKVAGTDAGITAIQVDIKVDGLSYDIIHDAFEITRKGRMQILNDVILPCIDKPREELSEFAPKITQIDIPGDKIRDVIGSGGKVIKMITEKTETQIDIEEEGSVGHVYIASPNAKAADKALSMIKTIVYDPEPGQVFDGVVTRLMNFGAFVEYAPGKEGLVHISKMSWDHVDKVEDVVEPGQTVKVIVSEIDSQGRVNLSMRDLMEKPEGYVENSHGSRNARGPRGSRGEGDDRRRGGRDNRRDNRRDNKRDNRREQKNEDNRNIHEF